jgi:hypothetical protein
MSLTKRHRQPSDTAIDERFLRVVGPDAARASQIARRLRAARAAVGGD